MILLSPHNDDAVLFAAFTCIRRRPVVVTIFDSYVQGQRGHSVTAAQRRNEDISALAELGCPVTFAGLRDDQEYTPNQIVESVNTVLGGVNWPGMDVIAPAFEEGGHDQHNAVALAAQSLGARSLMCYLTYRRGHARSIGQEVKADGESVWRKLRAMAHYRSQIVNDALGCWPWFMDLREFTA